LILGAWDGATKGAAPDDAAAAPSTATRQAPPAPPIKYLEAGANLFNSAQFDLASKYLEAANRYRDQLLPDEQSTLDAKHVGTVRYQGLQVVETKGDPTGVHTVENVGQRVVMNRTGSIIVQQGRRQLRESREQPLGTTIDARRKADEAGRDVKGVCSTTPGQGPRSHQKAAQCGPDGRGLRCGAAPRP
jgi:hypothetical protein